MDNLRLVLILSLGFVGMMLWQAWQKDYGVPPGVEKAEPAVAPGESNNSADVPVLDKNGSKAVKTERQLNPKASPSRKRVKVKTDTLFLEIDPQGATVRRAELLQYPVHHNKPNEPFILLNDTNELYYIVQGGVLSKESAPTHEAMFRPGRMEYALADGQDTLEVPFEWSENGIDVTKIFEFTRNSYLVKVKYIVSNRSSEPWEGRIYNQIKRDDPGRQGRKLIYTYTGAVLSTPEKRYQKISFKDIREEKLEKDVKNGWAAMIQHYFITALIPGDTDSSYHYYTNSVDDKYFTIGAISPAMAVAPGKEEGVKEEIYLGPKVQKQLEKIADGLDLTVDYGKLWFIAKPLFWCLGKIHQLTGNWGWAIILVTIMLKVLFFRLSAAGFRSMANMRRVQPRIMALRERYKNDKTRMNQAMMELYKEEKINPLGGCFPIVIQIPVFIALYWVLLESVEMRQANFALWINDLSSPDPYWVLPVLMGITMFVQQRLNPAPMDPIQQKVMMILPFAFTVFFGFFPSGLVLYWVVNNLLSIGQQWLITRSLERAGLSVRPKK